MENDGRLGKFPTSNTVQAVREELESHSEIPNDIPRTNSRGQERPAIASKLLTAGKKLSPTLRNPAPEPEPEPDCEKDTPAPPWECP